MLWSQRRNSGAHGAENLIQISALAVVEPRTLASRLPRTPPFSRLLRHAGDHSRTILTPNLQVVRIGMECVDIIHLMAHGAVHKVRHAIFSNFDSLGVPHLPHFLKHHCG